MKFLDSFDIVAVLLGVMFTIRKLDAQSRSAAQHPEVTLENFERWQRQTASAYVPGIYASFFREVFHFGFLWFVRRNPISPESFRHIGLLVDATWFVSVVATLVLAHFAREQARKLGISLNRPPPTRSDP
ncbi:MAG: hypothetical protein ABUL62_05155 [Myxococcales bacterium]